MLTQSTIWHKSGVSLYRRQQNCPRRGDCFGSGEKNKCTDFIWIKEFNIFGHYSLDFTKYILSDDFKMGFNTNF